MIRPTTVLLNNLGPFSAYRDAEWLSIGLDSEHLYESGLVIRMTVEEWLELKATVDAEIGRRSVVIAE